MTLSLSLELLTPSSTTCHESVRLRLTLQNDGGPVRVPQLRDPTDVLSIVARDASGEIVQRATGLTHQAMMTAADPLFDQTVWGNLPSSGAWSADFDLATYLYPLPSGDYTLQALYRFPSMDIDLASAAVPLRVAEPPITGIRATLDDCFLRGLGLQLDCAGGAAGTRSFVRLHAFARPLGAWHAVELPAIAGVLESRMATNAIFEPDVSSVFQERCWVARTADRLYGFPLLSGRVSGPPLSAPLPDSRLVLAGAFRRRDGSVTVALAAPGGSLQVAELGTNELVPRFVHGSSFHLDRPHAVEADEESIHVVTQTRELIHEKLDWSGAVQARSVVHTTRLRPHSCRWDPFARAIRAIYWEGPSGRTIELVDARESTAATESLRISLPFRRDLCELAFDRHPRGRFELLVSTEAGKLYYLRNESGPWLIAEGQERYFPYVDAEGKTFLGFWHRGRGYRFVRFSGRERGGRIVPPFDEKENLDLVRFPELLLDAYASPDHLPGDEFSRTFEDLDAWGQTTTDRPARALDGSLGDDEDEDDDLDDEDGDLDDDDADEDGDLDEQGEEDGEPGDPSGDDEPS